MSLPLVSAALAAVLSVVNPHVNQAQGLATSAEHHAKSVVSAVDHRVEGAADKAAHKLAGVPGASEATHAVKKAGHEIKKHLGEAHAIAHHAAREAGHDMKSAVHAAE